MKKLSQNTKKIEFNLADAFSVGSEIFNHFTKLKNEIEKARQEMNSGKEKLKATSKEWEREVKRGYGFTPELSAISRDLFSTVDIRTALFKYGIKNISHQTFILRLLLQCEIGLVVALLKGYYQPLLFSIFGEKGISAEGNRWNLSSDMNNGILSFTIQTALRIPGDFFKDDMLSEFDKNYNVGTIEYKFSINISDFSVEISPAILIFDCDILEKRHIMAEFWNLYNVFCEKTLHETYKENLPEKRIEKIIKEAKYDSIKNLELFLGGPFYNFIKTECLPYLKGYDFWCMPHLPTSQKMCEYKNNYILTPEGIFLGDGSKCNAISIKDQKAFNMLIPSLNFSKSKNHPVPLKSMLDDEKIEILWYLIRLSISEKQWILGRGAEKDLQYANDCIELQMQKNSQALFSYRYSRGLFKNMESLFFRFTNPNTPIHDQINEAEKIIDDQLRKPFINEMLGKEFFYCEKDQWDDESLVESTIFDGERHYCKIRVKNAEKKIKNIIEELIYPKEYKEYKIRLISIFQTKGLAHLNKVMQSENVVREWVLKEEKLITDIKISQKVTGLGLLISELSIEQSIKRELLKEKLEAYLENCEISFQQGRLFLTKELFHSITGNILLIDRLSGLSPEVFFELVKSDLTLLLRKPDKKKDPLFLKYAPALISYLELLLTDKGNVIFRETSLLLDFFKEIFNFWSNVTEQNGIDQKREIIRDLLLKQSSITKIDEVFINPSDTREFLNYIKLVNIQKLIPQWKILSYRALLGSLDYIAKYLKQNIHELIFKKGESGLDFFFVDEVALAVRQTLNALNLLEKRYLEQETLEKIYEEYKECLKLDGYSDSVMGYFKLAEKNLNNWLLNVNSEQFSLIKAESKKLFFYFSDTVTFDRNQELTRVMHILEKLRKNKEDLNVLKEAYFHMQDDIIKKYKYQDSETFDFHLVKVSTVPTLNALNKKHIDYLPLFIMDDSNLIWLYGRSIEGAPILTPVDNEISKIFKFTSTGSKICFSNQEKSIKERMLLVYKDIALRGAHFVKFLPWPANIFSEMELKWISHMPLSVDIEIMSKVIERGNVDFFKRLLKKCIWSLERESSSKKIIDMLKKSKLPSSTLEAMKKIFIETLQESFVPTPILKNRDLKILQGIKAKINVYGDTLKNNTGAYSFAKLLTYGLNFKQPIMEIFEFYEELCSAWMKSVVNSQLQIFQEKIQAILNKPSVKDKDQNLFKTMLEEVSQDISLMGGEFERNSVKREWERVIQWFKEGAIINSEPYYEKLIQNNQKLNDEKFNFWEEKLQELEKNRNEKKLKASRGKIGSFKDLKKSKIIFLKTEKKRDEIKEKPDDIGEEVQEESPRKVAKDNSFNM